MFGISLPRMNRCGNPTYIHKRTHHLLELKLTRPIHISVRTNLSVNANSERIPKSHRSYI